MHRLQGRLSAAEKIKLDQHLTALAELEKQFKATGTGSCVPPTPPDATSSPR